MALEILKNILVIFYLSKSNEVFIILHLHTSTHLRNRNIVAYIKIYKFETHSIILYLYFSNFMLKYSLVSRLTFGMIFSLHWIFHVLYFWALLILLTSGLRKCLFILDVFKSDLYDTGCAEYIHKMFKMYSNNTCSCYTVLLSFVGVWNKRVGSLDVDRI